MKTEQITPTMYAQRQGLTLSAVTKRIRKNQPLKGVLKLEKFSRYYLLTVEKKNKRKPLKSLVV